MALKLCTKRFIGISTRRPYSTVQRSTANVGVTFELSDEQREFQDLARKFAKNEIAPKAVHHDRTGEFPWDSVKKAHAAGLMNYHIATEFGGAGLSVFDACLISEELAYGCTGIALAITSSGLGVSVHSICGDNRQWSIDWFE